MSEKILIVGPSWIGDMVMAQSLFKLLRQKYPASLIDVVAPKFSSPLLARMPEVNRTIVLDSKHGKFDLKKRFLLGKVLRDEKYTRAIVIPRSFKSALVAFFAKVKIRSGFLGEMRFGLLNDIRKLDKEKLSSTVSKMLTLGLKPDVKIPEPVPYPELDVDKNNQSKLFDKFDIKSVKILGLMPGAEYGPAKQWPAEYFAKVAINAFAKGYQIIILGSEKDKAIAEKIKKLAKINIHNLCGQTTIEGAVDLLSACDMVVTNDSGLMHVAAAVGSEIHAIYGSSSPDYTPPLSEKKHIYYYSGEKCNPCFKRTCGYQHYNCLKKVNPDNIEIT